jgi:hypothetical protein
MAEKSSLRIRGQQEHRMTEDESILWNHCASSTRVEDGNELAGVLGVHARRRESDVLAIDDHTIHDYAPLLEVFIGGGDDDRELRLGRDVAQLGDDLGKRDRARGCVGKLSQSVELVGEEGLGRGVLGEQADERAVGSIVFYGRVGEDGRSLARS